VPDDAPFSKDDLAGVLATGRPDGLFRRAAPWIGGALLVVAIGAGYVLSGSGSKAATPRYGTTPASRGNLVVTVSATGNLQPTNQVDVGSELSGTIEAVLVDDNYRVRKGQVLARLDVSRLEDQVTHSRAAVAAADAQVLQTEATVEESRANLNRLRDVYKMTNGTLPSKSDLDTADATLKRAVANEANARAATSQARATLKSDETNLTKATIRSPIDGVVLKRNVEPGQTVAASLQAPILFTLAEDLAQMELHVDVDEADVGQVKEGQSATFTVDAYPNRKYPGRITRVDFGSQVKEGVVSYMAVLAVNNDDLSLRPGMTATADIIAASKENVLLVPSAALRFTPPTLAKAASPPKSGGLVSSLLPRMGGGQSQPPPKAGSKDGPQQIWILRDGRPVAVEVTVGASDGLLTEVLNGSIEPGTPVITEILGNSR
jgi:HlyD family secretion protein